MKTATAGLSTASGEVIDNHDQYEVFNDPRAVSALTFVPLSILITPFFSLIPLILSSAKITLYAIIILLSVNL